MSTIEVTLGVFWRQAPVVIRAQHMPAEINPEHIFQACNRIDHVTTDVQALAALANGSMELAAGLVHLRRQLDLTSAPSMSVEDYFDVLTEGGVALVRYKVQPTGWATTPHPHLSGLR
jgi:hypothetical protein